MNHSDFCDIIGIKKSAYYNKVNGFTEWSLTELYKLLEIKKKHRISGELTVSYDGINYKVNVQKVA